MPQVGKEKEGRESQKFQWTSIPPRLTCDPHMLIRDTTSCAARLAQWGQSASRNKKIACRLLLTWDRVRKVSLSRSVSYQSTFLRWELSAFYSRGANLFHCTCAHTRTAVGVWKCVPPASAWILSTSWPRHSHARQCHQSPPPPKSTPTVEMLCWVSRK